VGVGNAEPVHAPRGLCGSRFGPESADPVAGRLPLSGQTICQEEARLRTCWTPDTTFEPHCSCCPMWRAVSSFELGFWAPAASQKGEGRQQKAPHLLQAGHYAGPSLQLLRDVAVGEVAQRRTLLQPLQVGLRVQPRARHRRPAYETIERFHQNSSVNCTCKSQRRRLLQPLRVGVRVQPRAHKTSDRPENPSTN